MPFNIEEWILGPQTQHFETQGQHTNKVFEEARTRYEKEHPEVLKENDEETGREWYEKHINSGFFDEIINAIWGKM